MAVWRRAESVASTGILSTDLDRDTIVDRDSSVGITIPYGLDGPVIESRWGARFSGPVQTDSGAHPTSYTMGTGSLSRG